LKPGGESREARGTCGRKAAGGAVADISQSSSLNGTRRGGRPLGGVVTDDKLIRGTMGDDHAWIPERGFDTRRCIKCLMKKGSKKKGGMRSGFQETWSFAVGEVGPFKKSGSGGSLDPLIF